jgi:hypothetical protein
MAGVNLHTWTSGWGTLTYWNAFVANLELQGQGTFFDAPERPEEIPGCCPCWFRKQAERDGHGDRETAARVLNCAHS